MMFSIRLVEIAAHQPGMAHHVMHHEVSIAVFQIEGRWHVMEGSCPHAGAPLSDGVIQDGMIVCPWHAWRFRLHDGQCPLIPSARLKVYEVHESNGWLWALGDLPQDESLLQE